MSGRRIDSEKLVRWYDLQAPFYSLWRDSYDGPAVNKAGDVLAGCAGVRTVLDVGCGTGLFTIGLAQRDPQWSVEGLDASPGMLAVGRRHARRKGLTDVAFRQGDATALPYDDAHFDAVVAGGLFPNLNDPRPALDEMHRVLRPGGPLVIIEVDRSRMTPLARLLFRTMILGQRVVSTLLPRYRFAERWDVEKSTIDHEAFDLDVIQAGFESHEAHQVPQHLVLAYLNNR